MPPAGGGKENDMRIVLASASPRRRELLGELFESFEICAPSVDEGLPEGTPPHVGVELLALRKGKAVAAEAGEDALVISSDTLVELDGEPLGKPHSDGEALAMLRRLSGKRHNVHTGVAVHYRGAAFSGVATTTVTFRPLSDEEMKRYVASGEPRDKAGAYAIQGGASRFVAKREGELDTVIGLSLALTRELCERAVDAARGEEKK